MQGGSVIHVRRRDSIMATTLVLAFRAAGAWFQAAMTRHRNAEAEHCPTAPRCI